MGNGTNHINAMPTKAFFVDMLVKDIPLQRAVLDLVDNCIDGAIRLRPSDEPDFTGLHVNVRLSEEEFEITDNCGGFDVETAKEYAFRFGRPKGATSTDYSIGQFGVGMKRALFKFGRYFEVHSTTSSQKWSMSVDVDEWVEDEASWFFDFTEISGDQSYAKTGLGTRILVRKLRPEVGAQFSNMHFKRRLAEMIRSHQRRFLACGLSIEFEGAHLTNTELRVSSGGKFSPAVEEYCIDNETDEPVSVRIIAGVSDSSPKAAGWYIICNGRVILSADRSEATGWDSVAEQRKSIPKFHNQYARFRGVTFFDCRSSAKLPWNTTKTGLDETSVIWQKTFLKMLDHTRTVINFLNELDAEIVTYGKTGPLLSALRDETQPIEVEAIRGEASFSWNREPRTPAERTVQIQYSREFSKIEAMKTALGVRTAKAVGEKSFDSVYRQQCDDDE